ncbi:MAG TPA: DUF917 domain-containing protein [Acidimicrobiia bacterium]|nr:DUF917 domain-containing protein [Acidimicrobiia bacterium]
MTSTRIENRQDAEALILGLGMFATGGGGLASRGRGYFEHLFNDSIEVSWTTIDDVDPETLTCSVFGMGSIAPHPPLDAEERIRFGVPDGERFQRPWVRAVDELAAHLGREIGAIVPFELGPSNTLVALDAAARSNRTLIDGDYIGRALPKMSQALPAVLGHPTWPVSICDPWGNALIMTDAASPTVAERIGKMISRVTKAVDMGASCSHAAFPAVASQAAMALVPGTLSRSLEVGRRVLAARADGTDPVTAALGAVDGYSLFRGEVSQRMWDDTADGYMEGTTVVEGSGEFAGTTAEIWFQNEHHLVKVGDRYVAMSPDIVAVVDSDDAEPISNTELAVGRRVAVIGIGAAAPYRLGVPLAITEPRHYGFEMDYVPIGELNPDRGRG